MNKFIKLLFGKPGNPVTLEETTALPNCTNCGAELSGPFCSNCGQKKEHKHDLTVLNFIGHTLHEFTHFDSRFFKSFKYLVTKPGYLTEEFIKGHRKNYINPIRLFIIINIIYLFLPSVNTFTTPLQTQMNDRYRNIVRPMVNNKVNELGISYAEYEKEFDKKIKEHAEMLIIVMVVLFSVLLSLLYFSQRRYFVEHLILSLNIYSILLFWLSIGFLFFELVFFVLLLSVEKIMVLGHLISKPEAHEKLVKLMALSGEDVFLSIFLTIVILIFLFGSLKRIFRESNFVTFLKTIVALAGLYGIVLIYRLLLFFTTFYTLHISKTEEPYTQHWVSISKEKTSSLPWIKFEWTGDSLGKRYFDKAAMKVPVEIENLPHAFDMQFDMGSNVTMLYENPIKPYIGQYGILKQKLLQDKKEKIDGKPLQQMKGMLLGLDSQYFKSDFVILNNGYGDRLTKDSMFTPTPKQIGTIGVDICHDIILVIDYPNKRFCLLERLPDEYNCDFNDFTLSSNGKVILDMIFKDKKYKVLFDNGSSLFPLIVKHNMMDAFSKANNTDTLSISSWGQHIDFIDRPLKDSIYIGGRAFSDIEIYTSLKPGQENIPTECDAVTGNALFWNNIVIIDFKNKKFGIK